MPRRALEYLPGQIVVRVHEAAVRPHVAARRLAIAAETAELLPDSVAEPLDFIARSVGVRDAWPLFAAARPGRQAALRPHERLPVAVARSVAESESEELAGLTVVELRRREVSPELLQRVSSAPGIDFAEPIPARWLSASPRPDPRRNRQWGLRAIRWFEANRPSARRVTVAVVDTGIDREHPDLEGVVTAYDHRGTSARDVVGHGTHVGGIIAGRVNDEAGASGVADCRLAMWKVFPDEPAQGNFYVDGPRFLQALNEVGEAGAKVLNLSLGGTSSSQTEQLLFSRLERLGVTVVAAMGNEYQRGNPVEYPAAYDGVFAVGSIAEPDTRSPFSNTGRHIGLTAPGSNVLSTLPRTSSPYRAVTGYASWSGTSMATPHVAAVAALLAAKHSDWTAHDIKAQLQASARRVAGMGRKKRTDEYGPGVVDLQAALS